MCWPTVGKVLKSNISDWVNRKNSFSGPPSYNLNLSQIFIENEKNIEYSQNPLKKKYLEVGLRLIGRIKGLVPSFQ